MALVSFYALPSSPVINLSPNAAREEPHLGPGSAHYRLRRTGGGRPVTVRPSVCPSSCRLSCRPGDRFCVGRREWLSQPSRPPATARHSSRRPLSRPHHTEGDPAADVTTGVIRSSGQLERRVAHGGVPHGRTSQVVIEENPPFTHSIPSSSCCLGLLQQTFVYSVPRYLTTHDRTAA